MIILGYVGAYAFGMFFTVVLLALFSSDSDKVETRDNQIKKLNAEKKLLKSDFDKALDGYDKAVLAYKVLADEYEYLMTIREHLEDRLLTNKILRDIEEGVL